MMYPPLAKVKYEELGEVFGTREFSAFPCPELGHRPGTDVLLAIIFLRSYPEYMVGLS